jgi:hypothetical protein
MTVYGPFYRVTHTIGLAKTTRTWYRQKPITEKPLYFKVEKLIRKAWSGEPDQASYTGWAYPDPLLDSALTPLRATIYQKAYGRLMAEVSGASSQIGADIGERKQAINSVALHAGQLLKAARALRGGRIPDFFKALGIRKHTVRSAASNMGQLWLEYSYGWKPLVEDIHNAVNVLQRPFPFKVVRGRAKGTYHVHYEQHVASPISDTSTDHLWVIRLQLQMKISVSNWVAWRANELGLINPVAIAWELVPFSFVVDWFLPIGNYLQSLTDFVGLNREDPFTTWYSIIDRDYMFTNQWWWAIRKDRRVNVLRELVLPSPPDLRSRFTGFYSARGANAIALLTSTLKDLPKVAVPGHRF